MTTKRRQQIWDNYFLEIADVVRRKSKDTSTKCGAVIVGPDNQIVTTGFNGFPRGIEEFDPKRWTRPLKYKFVEHAERNAIYNAARFGIALTGCTLYLFGMGPPTSPCTECAKAVIQSGIVRVVGRSYKPVPDTWIDDFDFAAALMKEAGVQFLGSE